MSSVKSIIHYQFQSKMSNKFFEKNFGFVAIIYYSLIKDNPKFLIKVETTAFVFFFYSRSLSILEYLKHAIDVQNSLL